MIYIDVSVESRRIGSLYTWERVLSGRVLAEHNTFCLTVSRSYDSCQRGTRGHISTTSSLISSLLHFKLTYAHTIVFSLMRDAPIFIVKFWMLTIASTSLPPPIYLAAKDCVDAFRECLRKSSTLFLWRSARPLQPLGRGQQRFHPFSGLSGLSR